MKSLKQMLPLAVCGMLGLASFSAAADNFVPTTPEMYLGGGLGYNWLNGQPFRDPNNPDHDFSESHLTWKGFAGLRFTNLLSVEGQYIDFGAHNRNSDNVKAHGWTTGLVLDVPLTEDIVPFAKAGALFWNSDGTFTSNGTPGGTGFHQSGTDFTWGGGVRFALTDNLDLRLEYERFRLDDTHVDNATAGLQFNF